MQIFYYNFSELYEILPCRYNKRHFIPSYYTFTVHCHSFYFQNKIRGKMLQMKRNILTNQYWKSLI